MNFDLLAGHYKVSDPENMWKYPENMWRLISNTPPHIQHVKKSPSHTFLNQSSYPRPGYLSTKRSVCKSIIKIKNKMWILVIDIARLKTKKYNEQFAEVSRICLKIFHIVHVWDIFVLLRAALLWLELEKGPMQNWLCRACCPLLEIFHV